MGLRGSPTGKDGRLSLEPVLGDSGSCLLTFAPFMIFRLSLSAPQHYQSSSHKWKSGGGGPSKWGDINPAWASVSGAPAGTALTRVIDCIYIPVGTERVSLIACNAIGSWRYTARSCTSRPPGLPISKLIRKQTANERLERATKRKVLLLLVLPCLGSILPVLALPLPSYPRPALAPHSSVLTSRLWTIISSW